MTDSRATSVTQPSVAGVALHLEPSGSGSRAGLMDALRETVRTGRLASGIRPPSARSLAADLGIARNTAADAYTELVAEGGSPHSTRFETAALVRWLGTFAGLGDTPSGLPGSS